MIRFGTLGAARITPDALIDPVNHDARCKVQVVAARSPERARKFAATHTIPQVADSYSDVINHPDIDAVYIPLPISEHCQWTIKALQAGKHVLCEKSFACNAREAQAMAAAAEGTNLVLMDAFHYRYHPIFLRAREIVAAGILGDIDTVDAHFHVGIKDPQDIRMNYATGGGVTMDIGCYPISWVRHILNAEPIDVTAKAITGPEHVDICLTTAMQFAGGISATTSGDMRPDATFNARLVVAGELGRMIVNNPLVPQIGNSLKTIVNGTTNKETFSQRPTFRYQMDAFIDAIEQPEKRQDILLTGPDDAIAQMRVIDQAYTAAGLKLRGM